MKKHDFKRIACLFAAVLLLVPGALIALAAGEEVSGSRVVVYDAPEGFDVRDDYVVEVSAGGEWLSVPVYGPHYLQLYSDHSNMRGSSRKTAKSDKNLHVLHVLHG